MRSFSAIAVFSLFATALSPWIPFQPADTSLSQEQSRTIPPKNALFRFKADYIVKATGEKIHFDLVRPCQPTFARDIFGDSVDLGPLDGKAMKPADHFAAVTRFPKVTSDGHAVVVKIPQACNGETTANGRVQADLLPYVIWFEDADDLSEGWMYATEDAYRSPHAKIEFAGASIETASAADFQDWMKHAGDGFRPSKSIKNPLGFTQKDTFGIGDSGIPSSCTGVMEMELPSELSKRVAKARPPRSPIYWTSFSAKIAGHAEEIESILNDIYKPPYTPRFGGHPIYDFTFVFKESAPTKLDGAFKSPSTRPISIFPYSHEATSKKSNRQQQR